MDDPTPPRPLVYEEHRTWTPRPIINVIITAILLIGGIALAVTTSVWPVILLGALWSLAAYPQIVGAATHAPALRADETGITLYSPPRSLHPGPTLTPWHDIQAVKLLPVRSNIGSRAADAIYIRTTTDEIDDELPVRSWSADAPGRVIGLANWRINLDQLAATTQRYAPTASIIDKR